MGVGSIWHWLIVLVIVVIIFGTKKLRNIGSDVGGAVKNFKDAMKEENSKPKLDDSESGNHESGRTVEGEVTQKTKQ